MGLHAEPRTRALHGPGGDVHAGDAVVVAPGFVEEEPVGAADLEQRAAVRAEVRHLLEMPCHRAAQRRFVADIVRVVDVREIALVVKRVGVHLLRPGPGYEAAGAAARERFKGGFEAAGGAAGEARGRQRQRTGPAVPLWRGARRTRLTM